MKPKTIRTISKVLAGMIGWALFAAIFTANVIAILAGGLLGTLFLIGPETKPSSVVRSTPIAVRVGKALMAALSIICVIAIGFRPEPYSPQNPWLLRWVAIGFMPGIMRLSIRDFGPTINKLCWGILFGAGITAIGESLGSGTGHWIGAIGGAVWGLIYEKIDNWIDTRIATTTTSTEAMSR